MVAAQPRMNRGPNPDAPKLMVSACRAADKALATLCADRIRSQIEGDVSFRTLVVMSKNDVENTLTASGYDPGIALAPGDAVALAKQLLSDFYIDATVEKAGAGYKLSAMAVLARDPNMKQPLGSYEHARLETIAGQVSKAFQEAFSKTFEQTKECFMRERERKYDLAAKAVADGMKAYPNSAWLRHCKLAVLKSQKAPGKEVAALLEEIIQADATNRTALRDLVVIYEAEGNKDKKIATLELLRAADPADATLAAQVVNTYAEMGLFDKARAVVEPAIAVNPGDINLVRPYWLILMNAKEYKKAIEVGKQMATMDTATADTAYFYRMIGAANADSNFAEAAELSSRAANKFHTVGEFSLYAVTFYRKAGNMNASVAAARRALARDPRTKDLRSQIASTFLDKKTDADADSAIAIAREMVANAEDKNQIAGVAVKAGDVLRQLPEQIKANGGDAATQKAAWEKALRVLAWSDTLARGTTVAAQAKFLYGVAALSLGSMILQDANTAKSCDQTKVANNLFVEAQIALPAGGAFAPDATRQVMGQLMQMNGYVDGMTKAYCK